MRHLTLLLLAVMVCLLVPSVQADLSTLDESGETGSWWQRFRENGLDFDLIAVKMYTSGDTFETETHFNFTNPGWSLLYENSTPFPTLASAGGPGVNDLIWSLHFAGDQSNQLAFDYVAFYQGVRVNTAHAIWEANGPWIITNYGAYSPYWSPDIHQIPVPAAGLLGVIGLSAVAWLRRRT